MRRIAWLSLLVVAAIGSGARGVVFVLIPDHTDDVGLVGAVSGQRPVRAFAAETAALRKAIVTHQRDWIERVLGRPAPKPAKGYAMPVGQSRMRSVSGLCHADETQNKDHTEFYPIGDFAGIKVWYGIDGETPRFALLYFKVDDSFPRLQKLEDGTAMRPAKGLPPAPLRKNAIDLEHWRKFEPRMSKEAVAALLSVPPGDYAPGTEYFSCPYGTQGTDGRKAHETLEWRGEKGRIAVDFDEKGTLVSSEFCRPGRDPATNIAERLKWDRDKFARLKKYVEERMATTRVE